MYGIQFRGPGNYTRDVAVNFKADASEMANYCLLLFLLPLQLFCGLIEKSNTQNSALLYAICICDRMIYNISK